MNDRVKRKCVCNDYSLCCLRMVDPFVFATAQKMSWVKLLFDNKYEAFWKTIELSALDSYGDMLWVSNAPECILNKLLSSQLAESIRTRYVYREGASKEIYDFNYSELGACQCLWFNQGSSLLRILDQNQNNIFTIMNGAIKVTILYISDLLGPPLPGAKLFEELILDFGVSHKDRRKYNFLMKNVPSPWLQGQKL